MITSENKKSEYRFYRQFKKSLKDLGLKAHIDYLGRIRISKDSDEAIVTFCPITLVYYAKYNKILWSSKFGIAANRLGMSVALSNQITGAADDSTPIHKRTRNNLLRIAGLK